LSTGHKTIDQSPDGRLSSEGWGSVLLELGSVSTADVVAAALVNCMKTVVIVAASLIIIVCMYPCDIPLAESKSSDS
jgi:hypothetical protein